MQVDRIEADGTQMRVTVDGVPDPNRRTGDELLVKNHYSYPCLVNLVLNSDLIIVTRRRLVRDNALTLSGPRRPVNHSSSRPATCSARS